MIAVTSATPAEWMAALGDLVLKVGLPAAAGILVIYFAGRIWLEYAKRGKS